MSGKGQFSEDQIKMIFKNFLETFNSGAYSKQPPRKDSKPLTSWVLIAKKDKYDEIQKATSLQFGKVLQAAIEESIERTYALLELDKPTG